MAELKCPGNVDLGVMIRCITRGENLVERLMEESRDMDFMTMAEAMDKDASDLHAVLREQLPLQGVRNYILERYGEIDKKSVGAYREELNQHIRTCQNCKGTWRRFMGA